VWGLERQCCSVNPRGREKIERRMRWVAAYGVGSGGALCKVITFSFDTQNITRGCKLWLSARWDQCQPE
jgi:hypothetical protein